MIKMAETKTNKEVLKEGFNQASITGVLVEKNLEIKESTDKHTGDKFNAISGTVSVRTGEHEVHQIRLYSKELTKAGKENALFKGYKTIQDEAVSVADVANNPDLKPDVVRVNGTIGTNEYYGQDGLLKQFQQVQGKFINRLTEYTNEDIGATFEVEVFVDKVRPEMDNEGEETGRVILESFIPTYSSITPYKFTVVAEGADFFTDTVEKGQTIKVYGQIINKKIEHVKMVEAGFGADIEEKTYTYENESLIQTAAMPYDEESNKAFKPELVKEALAKREVDLEKKKAGSGQQQQSSKPTGFGGGSTPAKKPESALKDVDVSKLF